MAESPKGKGECKWQLGGECSPCKEQGKEPKGQMERKQQSRESRNLGGGKDDRKGRPQKQRNWWGGRPPRLMFEPRWNK